MSSARGAHGAIAAAAMSDVRTMATAIVVTTAMMSGLFALVDVVGAGGDVVLQAAGQRPATFDAEPPTSACAPHAGRPTQRRLRADSQTHRVLNIDIVSTHTHTHLFNGPFPGLPTVECYYNSTITRFSIQTAGLAIRRQRSVFLSC